MHIFKNISTYTLWREKTLASGIEHTGLRLQSPRGEYVKADQFVLATQVDQDFGLKNKEIEDAEFNLIMWGIEPSKEMYDKLYKDDRKLYDAYRSLEVATLATNGKRRDSRSNIVFNKRCCLCYFQLFADTLIVISRSLDLLRAGKSDIAVVNRIAQRLGCQRFTFICLNPHIYVDATKVARRTDETSGI